MKLSSIKKLLAKVECNPSVISKAESVFDRARAARAPRKFKREKHGKTKLPQRIPFGGKKYSQIVGRESKLGESSSEVPKPASSKLRALGAKVPKISSPSKGASKWDIKDEPRTPPRSVQDVTGRYETRGKEEKGVSKSLQSEGFSDCFISEYMTIRKAQATHRGKIYPKLPVGKPMRSFQGKDPIGTAGPKWEVQHERAERKLSDSQMPRRDPHRHPREGISPSPGQWKQILRRAKHQSKQEVTKSAIPFRPGPRSVGAKSIHESVEPHLALGRSAKRTPIIEGELGYSKDTKKNLQEFSRTGVYEGQEHTTNPQDGRVVSEPKEVYSPSRTKESSLEYAPDGNVRLRVKEVLKSDSMNSNDILKRFIEKGLNISKVDAKQLHLTPGSPEKYDAYHQEVVTQNSSASSLSKSTAPPANVQSPKEYSERHPEIKKDAEYFGGRFLNDVPPEIKTERIIDDPTKPPVPCFVLGSNTPSYAENGVILKPNVKVI